MLYINQINFFDKSGDNINADLSSAITILIKDIEGREIAGSGATFNAYTDWRGKIIYVEIATQGIGYETGNYLSFVNNADGKTWDSSPDCLIFGNEGQIDEFNIIDSVNENSGFAYPSLSKNVTVYMDRISTGLISTENIYAVEKVRVDSDVFPTRDGYTFPTIGNYGPFNFSSVSANGVSAKLNIKRHTFDATTKVGQAFFLYMEAFTDLSSIVPGMYVIGTGIQPGTQIISVDYTYGILTVNTLLPEGVAISGCYAYQPHNLAPGSVINITTGPGTLVGLQTLTFVEDTAIYFDFNTVIATTTGDYVYEVAPQFEARIIGGDVSNFFLYTIDYNEDYPTINKSSSITLSLDNITNDANPIDNGASPIREINEIDLNPSLLSINIGFSAGQPGNYASVLQLVDVTFSTFEGLLFQSVVEAEAIAEDARLGRALSNFGMDVDENLELIFRDSDVNESLPNYVLLNQKRKEMLLQGDQIWPYVGSYKGLVNIINWFGYYDIRIKEYFLNVNQSDANYLKFRQEQIPFQLDDKGIQNNQLVLVPSKNYKKTSKFGLFYDIVRESGEFDEFGTPQTEDAFAYTNEEVLIKLFALKSYLKEKFLPLNARIVDITGEGVYYERYAVNTWNDVSDRYEITLTRPIDFTGTSRTDLIDLRQISPGAVIQSPESDTPLQRYLNTYYLENANVSSGGEYADVPTISFPGNAERQAIGYVKVRAHTGTYTIGNTSGSGYTAGDIITTAGGTYESPIKFIVNAVNGSGSVYSVTVSGTASNYQGSNYRALPEIFSQRDVYRWDPVENRYFRATASGFTASKSDINYEIESVTLSTEGKGYTQYPGYQLVPSGTAISDAVLFLDVIRTESQPVSYFNNGASIKKYNDAPGIPVGGVANLETSFDISWNSTGYPWNTFSGGDDAAIVARVPDPAPRGNGQIYGLEIIDSGSEYSNAPSIEIEPSSFGESFGTSSIYGGSLRLLEFEVTGVTGWNGTNDQIAVSPNLADGGLYNVTSGALITASGISGTNTYKVLRITGDNTSLRIVNWNYPYEPSSTAESTWATTNIQVGDKVKVHQGALISVLPTPSSTTLDTTSSRGYESAPAVFVRGGRTRTVFTWETLGRGNFYQLEWRIRLTEPKDTGRQFNYSSGQGSIDDLILHTVVLPYAGKYTVELLAYDTDNNVINEIKNNSLEVVIPEANFTFSTRYIKDCIDTWNDTYQPPTDPFNPPKFRDPDLIEYNWENCNGRWVNPVFNNSDWADAEIRWDSLYVGRNSNAANVTFPEYYASDTYLVSPVDNLEGPIVSYTDSTTDPSSVNPTITVDGQRSYPQISANEWIFLRRDQTVYQAQVLNVSYGTTGVTVIELVSTPPASFRGNPQSWRVLREIKNTVSISGNVLYDPISNPGGFTSGNYIKLKKTGKTPASTRSSITSKDAYGTEFNYIVIDQAPDGIYSNVGELGKIYQYRDYNPNNGSLNWNPTAQSSTWVFADNPSVNPDLNDHTGKLYFATNTGYVDTNAAPLLELQRGYSVLNVKVGYTGSIEIYNQRLRVNDIREESTAETSYLWGTTGTVTTIVADVVGLDGGSLFGLNAFLEDSYNAGYNVWLEYEYNIFPTRTWSAFTSSGDQGIYMDFNSYPASTTFEGVTAGQLGLTGNRGWFYDHGISNANVTLYVENAGTWKGGLGTLLTVNDINNELIYCDSSFTAFNQAFDEDAAENQIGIDVINWKNYREASWEGLCNQSWDTQDFNNPIPCGFVIDEVSSGGSIEFNDETPYVFVGISGGMNTPQSYSQAAYELNANSVGGLSTFNYRVSSSTLSDITFNINTLQYPYRVSGITGAVPSVGDVIEGPGLGPANRVTATGTTGSGYYATMSREIQPVELFGARGVSGESLLRDVQGLPRYSVYPLDVVTGTGISGSAQILEIAYYEGTTGGIKQMRISGSLNDSFQLGNYRVERITANPVAGSLLPAGSTYTIRAEAKTPSMSSLGTLEGYNGVSFITPNGDSSSVSNSYPAELFYNWLGYSPEKIGSFEGGIDSILNKVRFAQVYYSGDNPFGYRGWYPILPLSPYYSASSTGPFSNTGTALPDSYRLPASAIGGSFTWEDTWLGQRSTRVPLGSSVLFTADASSIAGKSGYSWKIYNGTGTLLANTLDSQLLWNFSQIDKYTVELTIADSNGNTSTETRNEFITVYEEHAS